MHFTFLALGPQSTRGIYLTDTAAAEPQRLFDADTGAVYVSGHLLFVRDGVLLAQPFDVDRLTIHGEPFKVADRVNFSNGMAALAAAPEGTLMFRQGDPGDRRQMIWFDRAGTRQQALATPDVGTTMSGVDLSPDGRRLVSGRQMDGAQSMWTLDVARGIWSRLTSGGTQAIWSPDGTRLAFIKNVNGIRICFCAGRRWRAPRNRWWSRTS